MLRRLGWPVAEGLFAHALEYMGRQYQREHPTGRADGDMGKVLEFYAPERLAQQLRAELEAVGR